MRQLRLRPSVSLPFLALAWILAAGAAAPAGDPARKEPLSPMDVLGTRFVTSVHPSPDGSRVAFTRLVPRPPSAKDPGPAYRHLFVVPAQGGEERLLMGGERVVREVAWSPDGTWITYLDRGEGAPHPEVYALPMDGGLPVRLTRTPRGVLSYAWRPTGGAIALRMRDEHPKERRDARGMGFRPEIVGEAWVHVSLHLWEEETGAVRRLTRDRTVFSFAWSPDGRKLAAGLAPRPLVDDEYMFTRLHVVDVESGRMDPLVANPGKLGPYRWSPDGTRLAYVSAVDINDPHAGMLYVVDAATRQPRSLTDGLEGMVDALEWLDERRILVSLSESVKTNLAVVDAADGRLRRVVEGGEVAFRDFARDPSSGLVALAGSTSRHPNEVFAASLEEGTLSRLTESNPWLSERALGRQSVVRYAARDGLEIEGVLMHPVDYQEGKRYPLVIVVHGGPEAHYVDGWLTSYGNVGQLMAGRGYCVWYPNYRASTGRGVAFVKANHGDPMGAEFDDHLDAIAHFDRQGLVDSSRVGLIGGSYGGYSAAWGATRHTEHFAAAVSFVPVVDLVTKWYTSDIPYEFYYVHYEETWPFEDDTLYRDRSPLTWAPKCRTPLLLLGGDADTRVHPSQPYMLYSAVKLATETPVRYVRYPGEGHGNRNNVYQYDFLVRAVRWLEHYLAAGDRRAEPPPPPDLDYSEWAEAKKEKEDEPKVLEGAPAEAAGR